MKGYMVCLVAGMMAGLTPSPWVWWTLLAVIVGNIGGFLVAAEAVDREVQ